MSGEPDFVTELERELYFALKHLTETVDSQGREGTPLAMKRGESVDDYSSRMEREEVFGKALLQARAALAKADTTEQEGQ